MDVSVLEVGRGVGIGLDGTGCERVKGRFLASFHLGELIARVLWGGDGSECSRYVNYRLPRKKKKKLLVLSSNGWRR